MVALIARGSRRAGVRTTMDTRCSSLRHATFVLATVTATLLGGCSEQTTSLELSGSFLDGSVGPRLEPMVELGQALFFDPELSGNRDISCGTCHVPFLTTSEGIPLSIGHGGTELGPFRVRGAAAIIPRHSLDLFHRSDLDALFWDGRVERLSTGEVVGPVPTPPGITTALQLASIVPLLDRHEMRGDPGDIGFDGRPNELATLDDDDALAIWTAIAARLGAIEGYPVLFAQAFGDPEIDIGRVAIALARFQEVFWGPLETTVVTDPARADLVAQGEALFRRDGGCARCHSGEHFTDERYHDLAVPPIGPGFADAGGLDEGRFRVTRAPADRFAFRTPPLRNVALTPPSMHDGAYPTLEAAIRHHFDPAGSLRAYTGEHLPDSLRATLITDPATLDAIAANAADAAPLRPLTDEEVRALIVFLESLTNPTELTRHPEHAVPRFVPSGLEVDRWNGSAHPFR